MIVDDFMNEDISKDIMVDDKLTSSIIGPKGSRIKAIRNRTSAMIKICTYFQGEKGVSLPHH